VDLFLTWQCFPVYLLVYTIILLAGGLVDHNNIYILSMLASCMIGESVGSSAVACWIFVVAFLDNQIRYAW
jgi:hypothetical protein